MGFNGRRGRLEVLGQLKQDEAELLEEAPHEDAQVPVASPPPPKGAKRGRKSAAEKAALAGVADQATARRDSPAVPTPQVSSSIPRAFKRR